MGEPVKKAIKLNRPGVKACGQYLANQVLVVGKDVDRKEAERLVKTKGFIWTSEKELKDD